MLELVLTQMTHFYTEPPDKSYFITDDIEIYSDDSDEKTVTKKKQNIQIYLKKKQE